MFSPKILAAVVLVGALFTVSACGNKDKEVHIYHHNGTDTKTN